MPRNREEADLFFCSVTPLQNVRNENSDSDETLGRGFSPARTRSGLMGTIQLNLRSSQAVRMTLASKAVSPRTTTRASGGNGNWRIKLSGQFGLLAVRDLLRLAV